MPNDYDWYSSDALEKQGVDGSRRPRTKQTPVYMPLMYDYGLKHAISVNSEYGGWGTWLKVFGSEDAALTKLTDAVASIYRDLDETTVAEPDLMPKASAVIEHAVSTVEYANRSAMYKELRAIEKS
jgi:hypothetical protein